MQPPSLSASPGPGRSVVLATHEYAPFLGGVATYVREVARAAHRLGRVVEVWTVDYQGRRLPAEKSSPSTRDPGPEPAADPAWRVVKIHANGRLTPGGILRLAAGFHTRRRELAGKPVVLLSVGVQMAFFLLDALRLRPGGRVTCFFHGSEVPRFRRNPFWRFLARRFYRRADAFAATTHYVADLLRTSGLLPGGAEVVLAPCALPEAFRAEVDTGSGNGDGDDGRQDADAWEWRVLTVARLHPRKGQLEVARALGLLPDALRARVVYQLVGVGDDSYRCEVAAACEAGGVRCEFLGGVEDAALGGIYRWATVYAQASRTLPQSVEGFGITFLEAAAHGCPAAAWRSGGVAEAVQDGRTGLLVEEGDMPGLAAIIARILMEPSLRASLGERARKFAWAFDWRNSARVLCGIAQDKDNGCSPSSEPETITT